MTFFFRCIQMTGAKIEIPTIHKLIQGTRMPPKMQHAVHMNIDRCHDIGDSLINMSLLYSSNHFVA